MAEMDGLGLVFEKQGNTGAAAYNQPVLQIGRNPLDFMAEDLKGQIAQKQKENLLKEQQRQELNRRALDFNPEGWDIDQQAFISKAASQIVAQGAKLAAGGKNLYDLNDPEVRAYEEAKRGLQDVASSSKTQRPLYEAAIKELYANPDKYDEQKSLESLVKGYRELNPAERMRVAPLDLLQKKYDPYQVIKGEKGDTFMETIGNKWDTPEAGGSRKTTKFSEKKAKEYVSGKFNTPEGKENYEYGVQQGWWSTMDQAIKRNVDQLKTTAKESIDTSSEVKAPKNTGDFTINDIYGSGTASDWVSNIGAGQQTPNVYDKSGKYTPTLVENAINVGDIKGTVSGETLIDAKTGQPIKSNDPSKAWSITSGTMSTPLVFTGESNRVVPVPAKGATKDKPYKLTYTNSEGQQVTEKFYGSRQDIINELKSKGIARYRPMIEGIAKSSDDDSKTVWIPADAIIHGSTVKDKVLGGAEKAYYVLQRWSDEMNNGGSGKKEENKPAASKQNTGQSMTQNEWNAAWSKLKSGQTMVGLDGKTYQKK